MAYEFKIVRRAEFAQTDMAGIVNYANYFRFMEAAEYEFFRSLGLAVYTTNVESPICWPRVHAECDYKHPLRYEDEVEIHLRVAEKGTKSLTCVFILRKLNSDPPIEVARGKVTTVYVRHDDHGRMWSCAFPQEVADKIEVDPGL